MLQLYSNDGSSFKGNVHVVFEEIGYMPYEDVVVLLQRNMFPNHVEVWCRPLNGS